MPKFSLAAGQSCHILSMDPANPARAVFAYRIQLDRATGCELKILRDNAPALMIAAKQLHRAIDVAASGNLYLEAVGRDGSVEGTYEFLGGA